MARVMFYEKPGCATNARQKAMLRAAGHDVIALDLLSHAWTPQELLSFLAPLPVARWFNSAAPDVKSGRVLPGQLGAAEALPLLVANPILIRRPLLECAGMRRAGFDTDVVGEWLTLQPDSPDVEDCLTPQTPCAPEGHP